MPPPYYQIDFDYSNELHGHKRKRSEQSDDMPRSVRQRLNNDASQSAYGPPNDIGSADHGVGYPDYNDVSGRLGFPLLGPHPMSEYAYGQTQVAAFLDQPQGLRLPAGTQDEPEAAFDQEFPIDPELLALDTASSGNRPSLPGQGPNLGPEPYSRGLMALAPAAYPPQPQGRPVVQPAHMHHAPALQAPVLQPPIPQALHQTPMHQAPYYHAPYHQAPVQPAPFQPAQALPASAQPPPAQNQAAQALPAAVPAASQPAPVTRLSFGPPESCNLPKCQIGVIELATYFPNHSIWGEVILRFICNGWNYDHIAAAELHGHGLLTAANLQKRQNSMRYRAIKGADEFFNTKGFQPLKKLQAGDQRMAPVTTYDATSYQPPGKIARNGRHMYSPRLVDLAAGVVNHPTGQDAGFVTQAIQYAVANNDDVATVDHIPNIAAAQLFALPTEANGTQWDQSARLRLRQSVPPAILALLP